MPPHAHDTTQSILSYADLTLALMISFPGGSGYNLKTLSQSCFNQGSTTASGLERKTLHSKRTDNVNCFNQINKTVNKQTYK